MKPVKQTSKVIYLLFILAVLILPACTGYNSYSKIARAGDTVSLAVGSSIGMTKDASNTTAVYVPDVGGSYPLTIRSVFNLYPDKKSRLNLTATLVSLIDSADHEVWQTVMLIDLPTNLPIGNGKVVITSAAIYPSINTHINDFPIALEIISGTGAPDAFAYEFGQGLSADGDLTQLESLPHAVVTPPVNAEFYGAIEMKLSLNMSTTTLDEQKVRVFVDDMNPLTLSNKNVVWKVSSAGELVVMIMSPSGGLQARESRLSIVSKPNIVFNSVPTITEVNFYDVNGNLVAGAPGLAEYNVAMY